MISSIRGRLREKFPTYVVVDVNGLGYGIHIPISTYEKLGSIDGETELYTYLHVREDCLQLYGFKTGEEKELFEVLISVSGVGPRVGLAILSGLTVGKFREAVGNGDWQALTGISGVGKKIAQRLVVELRDKIAPFSAVRVGAEDILPSSQRSADAVAALVSLGCRMSEARKAVGQAEGKVAEDAPVEALIKEAMRHL